MSNRFPSLSNHSIVPSGSRLVLPHPPSSKSRTSSPEIDKIGIECVSSIKYVQYSINDGGILLLELYATAFKTVVWFKVKGVVYWLDVLSGTLPSVV